MQSMLFFIKPAKKPARLKGEKADAYVRRVERWELRRSQKKVFWARCVLIGGALYAALKANASNFDRTEILTMGEFAALAGVAMKVLKMPSLKQDDEDDG